MKQTANQFSSKASAQGPLALLDLPSAISAETGAIFMRQVAEEKAAASAGKDVPGQAPK